MKYIALLRGINVGGNKKVSMKELKTIFESLGFTDVATYINSGNVIFSATTRNQKNLSEKIEKAIEQKFGFEVKVLTRDANNLKKLVEAIPPFVEQ